MPVLRNPKHERFARCVAAGEDQGKAIRSAGFKGKYLDSVASRLVKKSQIQTRIVELQSRVAERVIEQVEYNALTVLTRLVEIVELKASDFDRPRSEWTPAMERWACEQEDISVRSSDGVQAGESKAWDKVGTRIKITNRDKLKALEMIGRHKVIDAFKEQKSGDTNIVVITADRARQVVSAKKRLARATEEKPE